MKNLLISSLLFSLLTTSCGSQTENKSANTSETKTETTAPETRIIIARDSILTLTIAFAPPQSYSIYYPSSAGNAETTPVIVFFDPHAAGSLPVEKYKKLAARFGIAIAGSNSSKNGMSAGDCNQIVGNIETDMIHRLGFAKSNMTLAGFSGGAKVALGAAYTDPGIIRAIYMGATTAFTATHPMNLMGFAGQQDMNYSDLLAFDEGVNQNKPGTDLLIEHGGKHEWPESTVFEKAFYWLAFHSGKTDSALLKNMVKEFTSKTDMAISLAEKQNDPIALYQEYNIAVFILDGVTDISSYKSKLNAVAQSEKYKNALEAKKQIVNNETNTKQMLIQAFQNQNADWWTKVINTYKASQIPSDKRLLGFISLACYSYSNQTLQSHNLDGADKILAIYELCDAGNTDQLYGHALLYAMKGNTELAMKYLDKAVANGFKDKQKMEADPIFMALKDNPHFAQILASLDKKPK